MHLEVESDFIDELGKNTFLKQKVAEFSKAVDEKREKKFLDENPDFFQMMMHLAQSEKIRVVMDNCIENP